MDNIEQIKILLGQLKDNREKIVELERYNIDDIITVAIDNELYESLKFIFQPIEINGVVRIYFDAFSTDILDRIRYTCDSKKQAEEEAKNEYEYIQKRNAELSKEEREWFEDKRTYEEILSSKKVISKEIKEDLFKSLFTIDFDIISQIKVKDSHARQISGIGHPIRNINDIIFYSEPACLETCIELFNKNIQTTMNDTDGVIEDQTIGGGICRVHCNYESLSLENKKIVDDLIANGVARRFMDCDIDSFSIFVPCSPNDTIGEVSSRLKSISSKLLTQDILYGRATPEGTYSNFEDVINKYPSMSRDCFTNGFSIENLMKFTRKLGYNMIYDEQEGILWECPEYYQKHLNFLKSFHKTKNVPKK